MQNLDSLESLDSLISDLSAINNSMIRETIRILLSYKNGNYYNFLKEIVNLDKKFFILVSLKIQFTLKDKSSNAFYKSEFFDNI